MLPFYAVCDESYSMIDHLRTLNRALGELYGFARTSPRAAASVRLCLIGFAESARVVVPLSRIGHITMTADLSADAATNFGDAFTVLRATIERDVTRAAGSEVVHRPAVFFLSDGRPTDPAQWPAAHARLVDPTWADRPDIVAFGIGEADPGTINRIATVRSYVSDDRTTPAQALSRFTDTLARSMELTAAEGAGLRLPRQVPGFTTLAPYAV
jgi:uncharacterized protein YegL